MASENQAYAEIERLVNSFKILPAVQHPGMYETQTRLGYILPLFKALGRDPSNINEFSSDEEQLDPGRLSEREIKSVDEENDKWVYDLYGLTAEEIEIVEGKV